MSENDRARSLSDSISRLKTRAVTQLLPSLLSIPYTGREHDARTSGSNTSHGDLNREHTTTHSSTLPFHSSTNDSDSCDTSTTPPLAKTPQKHVHKTNPSTSSSTKAADKPSHPRRVSSCLLHALFLRRSRPLSVLLLCAFLLVVSLVFALRLRPTALPALNADKLSETKVQAMQRSSAATPWSVFVQHADAITPSGPAQHRQCTFFRWLCRTEHVTPPPLPLLPSWTLRLVDSSCLACTNRGTSAGTMRSVPTKAPVGDSASGSAVFATAAAPLGRVGPMLLAMTSVTNAIDLPKELPRWTWLASTSIGAPKNKNLASLPYLAVMGVPSTDQPARAALRDAQRATWLTYQEVARTENDFTGALLPLYLFAAVEPANFSALLPTSFIRAHSSHLLPTPQEFALASAARLAAANASANTAADGTTRHNYTMPRVVLRGDWQSNTPQNSPCASLVRVQVDGTAAQTDPLVYLGAEWALPVTPAAVAPAQFICHASAGLWQEALKHRNVVWIDMMTDRRPTTKKKLGDTGKWGLAVEVGMSQKLILWLAYAYHAFPDTPYIIKGDDDAYLKVPQFLNDVRFVLARNGSSEMQRTSPFIMPHDKPVEAATSLCTYWGSTRSVAGVRFNAGMGFMLHRRLAQAVLEPIHVSSESSDASPEERAMATKGVVDHVTLAMQDFNFSLSNLYRRLQFDREDVMLGYLLHSRLSRAQALCYQNKVFYVKETFARFHDLRVGRARSVTWASVVVHRCRVSDFHAVHYYFTHAYQMPVWTNSTMEEEEEAANTLLAAWASRKKREMPEVDTWDHLPSMQWVSRGNGPVAAVSVVHPHDEVAVYLHRYNEFRQPRFHVYDGYVSDP